MAALVGKYPDRFPAFVAALPLGDPDATMVELHRAIRDLGARGIQLFSNINGRPLDEPEYLAILAAMADYDLPIWLHPYRGAQIADYPGEPKSKYEIWWTFGWPYETSVAMARLVFAGVFDRHPNLKIITHHMGAMAPFFEGRVGPGWDQLGTRTSDEDYTQLLRSLKKRPLDYFKMFYGDTALFGSLRRHGVRPQFLRRGPHPVRVRRAVRSRKGPMYIRETIAIVDRLPVSEEERERIYWKNAVKLLKLEGRV